MIGVRTTCASDLDTLKQGGIDHELAAHCPVAQQEQLPAITGAGPQ